MRSDPDHPIRKADPSFMKRKAADSYPMQIINYAMQVCNTIGRLYPPEFQPSISTQPKRDESNTRHSHYQSMWAELPLDVLTHLFSYLPANSLANALCTCKHWHGARGSLLPPRRHGQPPWLLTMPNTHHSNCCHVRDTQLPRWYSLPLGFVQEPVRLVSYLGHGLLLCRLASSASLRLVICNPFTRQLRALPQLLSSRSNPAIGVIAATDTAAAAMFHYFIIVAGGASGGSYQSTLEMYDSRREGDGWRLVGPMPIEFAIRLTVWTPHDSVHISTGFLFWITSARAYTVVRLDLACWAWTEVKLPMADRLAWAAIFKRKNGRVGLIGGSPETTIAQVWELDNTTTGDKWKTVSMVPFDLAKKFSQGGMIKCAGAGEAVYLYRDLGSEMLVWSEIEGAETEGWNLVEGRSNLGINLPLFKAASIHPSLAHSFF